MRRCVVERKRPRNRLAGPAAVALVTFSVLLSGCATDRDVDQLPTRVPATPAAAPAATAPAGTVSPVQQPIQALLVEAHTQQVVALAGPDASTLVVFADLVAAPTVVRLETSGAGVAQGQPGEVLVPATDQILRVAVATGELTAIPLPGQHRAVRRREDGGLLVGSADGTVWDVDSHGQVREEVTGLVSADALAVTGEQLAVLDRRQTSVTEMALDHDRLGLALRAGSGATHMIEDPFGRVIITDTDGGELLVYTLAPLVLRQRFPVGSAPYALAYDQRTDTVWVTQTGSNTVVGFDLSTGIPEEVGRFSTVQQPNSVAIHPTEGLLVGSATGGGLQRIAVDPRKKGQ